MDLKFKWIANNENKRLHNFWGSADPNRLSHHENLQDFYVNKHAVQLPEAGKYIRRMALGGWRLLNKKYSKLSDLSMV